MDLLDPPMELGETLKGTDSDGNLINTEKLGQRYTFPASRVTSNIRGSKGRYTGKPITALLVRNVAGFAVLGKRTVKFRTAAGYDQVEAIDGYCAITADAALAFSDPYLPAAGCADDDLMWVITDGPTTVLTPFEAGGFTKTIAAGDFLIGATAATTGTSGAGRVSVAGVLTGGSLAATDAYAQAKNILGRALSARTTGETNADLLIDACVRF